MFSGIANFLTTVLSVLALVSVGVALGWWLKVRHLNISALVQKRVGTLFSRVFDLTTHLEDDVREHGEHLMHVSQRLAPFGDDVSTPIDERLARAALAELLEGNRQLLDRLSQAEQRLQEYGQKAGLDLVGTRCDALTGLPNRQAFDDELKRRFAEWQRTEIPFSLVLVEIDHFDALSSKYGHEMGDLMLQNLSVVVASIVREMDMVSRYSAGQLAVVLPSSGLPEVLSAAERVRLAAAETRHKTRHGVLQLTVSLGISEAMLNDNPQLLVRRAEEALQTAQRDGHNRSYYHDGSDSRAINLDQLSGGSAAMNGELAAQHRASKLRRRHDMRAARGGDAQVDPITGVPNRRAFSEELRSRAAEATRGKRPLSLLLIAVDRLDTVRAFHDQSAVDRVFRAVAPAICDAVREMDLVTRYGWEEFAVILPSTNMQEAIRANDRVAAAVAQCLKQFDYNFEMTLSCGIAERLPHEEPDDFVKRADAALRASQQCGGSRTHLHAEGGLHVLPAPTAAVQPPAN